MLPFNSASFLGSLGIAWSIIDPFDWIGLYLSLLVCFLLSVESCFALPAGNAALRDAGLGA